MVAFNFSARQVEPDVGFEAWPVGWHKVIIHESGQKPTKDGKGMRLVLGITAVEGPMQGKTNNIGLNVGNANQQAMEIAYKQLSAICHVTGVFDMTDTSNLHNIPFLVEYTKRNDGEGTQERAFRTVDGRNAKDVREGKGPSGAAPVLAGAGPGGAGVVQPGPVYGQQGAGPGAFQPGAGSPQPGAGAYQPGPGTQTQAPPFTPQGQAPQGQPFQPQAQAQPQQQPQQQQPGAMPWTQQPQAGAAPAPGAMPWVQR